MGCSAKKITAQYSVVFLVGVFLAGCASSPTRHTTSEVDATEAEELRAYESEFRPSNHDGDISEYFTKEAVDESAYVAPPDSQEVEITQITEPEFVQGFRVQLFSTTQFEELSEKKVEVERLFPDERFYVVYDPPVYKIRVGNFLTRFAADQFSKKLEQQGYKNSWIVPEKIEKDEVKKR